MDEPNKKYNTRDQPANNLAGGAAVALLYDEERSAGRSVGDLANHLWRQFDIQSLVILFLFSSCQKLFMEMYIKITNK
jgi:hypothetical protein